MIQPVQYIILNKGLGMSTGKAAAQAAHASVEGLRVSAREPGGNPWDASIVNLWYRSGHYTKIVLEVADADALLIADRYISDRNIRCSLIIDEGRTEIDPMTPTALGSQIVDKNSQHVRDIFGEFKLYNERDRERALVRTAAEAAAHETARLLLDKGAVKRRWRKYVEEAPQDVILLK